MEIRESIAKFIAGADLDIRINLALRYDLYEDEYAVLANDIHTDVREIVADKALSADCLRKLHNDKSPKVRAAALSNARTDFETFRDAVMGTSLSAGQKRILCGSGNAVKSAEVFTALWSIKNYDYLLLGSLRRAVQQQQEVDGGIFQFVEANILTASDHARQQYALWFNTWTTPETLDALKDDPYRPVINELAQNGRAWVSTHEYLAMKHKTPAIRIGIAKATGSNELLNRIYQGTKSKDIRDAVEENPAFSLL